MLYAVRARHVHQEQGCSVSYRKYCLIPISSAEFQSEVHYACTLVKLLIHFAGHLQIVTVKGCYAPVVLFATWYHVSRAIQLAEQASLVTARKK